jgi:hypothetical protein
LLLVSETGLPIYIQGRIQDFKLGGGGALKNIAARGGSIWGISCEKSRFYAKKSYFFQLPREARKFWGISCEKSRFYANFFNFFRILGGRPPPPESAPAMIIWWSPGYTSSHTIHLLWLFITGWVCEVDSWTQQSVLNIILYSMMNFNLCVYSGYRYSKQQFPSPSRVKLIMVTRRVWRYQSVIRICKSMKDRQHNGQRKNGQRAKLRFTKHHTEN